ncbi:ras-related protein Rab-34-like isoform X2 [Tachypleus tridentatus]|uniref:ras-related protein Rab-34-like isoform X2 n=2 Tax=Tachypleus tridentatus TaxID=6853 RepID=UPI003FD3C942
MFFFYFLILRPSYLMQHHILIRILTGELESLKISKTIFVGDVAVGKTFLVNRFCYEVFYSNYKSTIGVDFEVERFDILNAPFHLQIWDTAGQERFKSISAAYYRGTKGENIMEFFSRLAALCFNYSVHREMEVLQRSEVSKDFVKLSEYGKKREENF